MKYNEEIKLELSQAYRILASLGLDDHTYTHLSSRSSEGDSYYIYPFGLRFAEVEPNILMKISLNGEILEGEEYQYNKTGYIIHGEIYKERSDVNSIFHVHATSIVAVSACEAGLMPISQWALHFYNQISYHNYDSLALDNDQGSNIVKDLGENFTLLLKNHGAITSGRTIEEAMFYSYHLYQACKTQCLALSMNQKLILPSDEICTKAANDLLSFEQNLGERDWKAWVRMIENK
ncbi:MAG: class II aldolase/adducin family protein [Alphaproteobacteria bacterium]